MMWHATRPARSKLGEVNGTRGIPRVDPRPIWYMNSTVQTKATGDWQKVNSMPFGHSWGIARQMRYTG